MPRRSSPAFVRDNSHVGRNQLSVGISGIAKYQHKHTNAGNRAGLNVRAHYSKEKLMSKATVADHLIERLIEWGVDTIFGFPGDGINGIFEALRTHQDKMRFIQVRHEEAAAFAACGYAKFTGRLGVCLATSGPGGIHLLNGLYDAKCDLQPVLAITGHTFDDLIGTHYQQDVDLDKLFMDVAAYNQ